MMDTRLRRRLAPSLEWSAEHLARRGVSATALTLTGLVLALVAAGLAAAAAWNAALVLWLVSRLPDGLDGPVARVSGGGTALGGWSDISADLAAYGAFIAGCGIGNPDARVACLVLLTTYYVNGGSLLALSAARSDRGLEPADGRTFHFSRGLAEGTETIVVHAAMVLLPAAMAGIAWGFAAVVLVTILQRIATAVRLLG